MEVVLCAMNFLLTLDYTTICSRSTGIWQRERALRAVRVVGIDSIVRPIRASRAVVQAARSGGNTADG